MPTKKSAGLLLRLQRMVAHRRLARLARPVPDGERVRHEFNNYANR